MMVDLASATKYTQCDDVNALRSNEWRKKWGGCNGKTHKNDTT